VNNKQSGSKRKRGKLLITGVILCSGVAGPLQAGESAYGVGYMGEHSDNITRVSTNEQSDWIHSLLAGFAYQERTTDMVARVLAQATYYDYQKDTFSDETLFDLNSSAVWTISPQRFFWTVQDDYQQALLNATLPDTPANRTNLNVFSTGPDVYLRLAPVHTLMFGARVGDVYTGDANADNKRFSGLAGWLYQSSPVTTLSLNYQVLDVKFEDSTLNNDFTSQDLFFRAQFRPSRSQYILDLGTTHINFDRGEDLRGTLARLSWIRELTPQSSFGASVSKEFSNTASDVLAATPATDPAAGEPTAPSGISRTVITADVYETKGGTIFYTHRGSQVGVQFLAGRRKLDYATTPQDRKETNGRLQIDYFFSAASTATLFTEYTRTEYLDFIRRDTDQNSGLRFDYHLTRTVSVGLEGRRTERRSTDSTVDFVDNRLLFTLLYSSGPLFTPLHRR